MKTLRIIWNKEYEIFNYNQGNVVWANTISMAVYLQIKDWKAVLEATGQIISVT